MAILRERYNRHKAERMGLYPLATAHGFYAFCPIPPYNPGLPANPKP